jgi:hypothetical protein
MLTDKDINTFKPVDVEVLRNFAGGKVSLDQIN